MRYDLEEDIRHVSGCAIGVLAAFFMISIILLRDLIYGIVYAWNRNLSITDELSRNFYFFSNHYKNSVTVWEGMVSWGIIVFLITGFYVFLPVFYTLSNKYLYRFIKSIESR